MILSLCHGKSLQRKSWEAEDKVTFPHWAERGPPMRSEVKTESSRPVKRDENTLGFAGRCNRSKYDRTRRPN